MVLESDSGIKYQYSCDSCEYQGDDYERRPIEPEGEQVRCPECSNPTLERVAV